MKRRDLFKALAAAAVAPVALPAAVAATESELYVVDDHEFCRQMDEFYQPMRPRDVNSAFREIMAQIKAAQ